MYLAERDETTLAFVPQHEPHTPEALKQRKPANAVELRVVAQHERQSVTGDPTTQMMDVVNADVGGEPAQKAEQGIMRAAVKRRLLQIPGLVVNPRGILKLVLDIKQPDTNRSREQHDWQMHEQKWTDAHQPAVSLALSYPASHSIERTSNRHFMLL